MLSAQTTYDENRKLWYGKKTEPNFAPKDSLGTLALAALRRDPEHIAQICSHNGKQYTNREIADLAVSIAKHFMKLDLEQGDVIGFHLTNTDLVASLFFGAIFCGYIVNAVDPRYEIDDLVHVYSASRPKIIFCDGKDCAKIEEVIELGSLDAKIYTVENHVANVPNIEEFLHEDNSIEFRVPPLKFGIKQTAVILPTSGTTGYPKCMCLTHEGLLMRLKTASGNISINFSTLHWFSGLASLLFGTLENRTRIITKNNFTTKEFFEIVEKYKPTFAVTPPFCIHLSVASPEIENYDLSSVRVYLIGGGFVSTKAVEQMKKYMKNAAFINVYTMCKASGMMISAGHVQSDGRVGGITDNTEIKIVDPAGNSLGPGEKGEIWMRLPIHWQGYYNNPEATDRMRAPDNWLRTGDLGYIDNDGILFLIDRLKDTMKYNNFQFTPTEIEFAIYELPDVVEVAVCGLPDPISGHLPAAAVVLKSESKLCAQDVADHITKTMADFKRLRGGVFIVDSIPKTSSGKVRRRNIVAMCEKLRKLQNDI